MTRVRMPFRIRINTSWYPFSNKYIAFQILFQHAEPTHKAPSTTTNSSKQAANSILSRGGGGMLRKPIRLDQRREGVVSAVGRGPIHRVLSSRPRTAAVTLAPGRERHPASHARVLPRACQADSLVRGRTNRARSAVRGSRSHGPHGAAQPDVPAAQASGGRGRACRGG